MELKSMIGVLLDLVHDIVERDEPMAHKRDELLKLLEANDRIDTAFGEFISWFKLEED